MPIIKEPLAVVGMVGHGQTFNNKHLSTPRIPDKEKLPRPADPFLLTHGFYLLDSPVIRLELDLWSRTQGQPLQFIISI